MQNPRYVAEPACQLLKGQCHKIFASDFFHESVSPPAPEYSSRIISNFLKILEDTCKSRCTTGLNDTGGKFATGINDTGGKFATSFASVVVNIGKFDTSVNNNCGKLATGVDDAGGKQWEELSNC
jgi:hypothetical protein